jgi:hypothetical protein
MNSLDHGSGGEAPVDDSTISVDLTEEDSGGGMPSVLSNPSLRDLGSRGTPRSPMTVQTHSSPVTEYASKAEVLKMVVSGPVRTRYGESYLILSSSLVGESTAKGSGEPSTERGLPIF